MPAFTDRERIESKMTQNPGHFLDVLEATLTQGRLDAIEAAFPLATEEKIAELRSMKRAANKLGMATVVDAAKAEIDKLQAEQQAPRA